MDEGVVGISRYFTSAPGLGGRIKASAEDLVVAEGSVWREIRVAGGCSNFVWLQWFGSVRPISHVVGRRLVRGEIKEDVMAYVANPMPGEDPGAFAAREDLEATGDIAAALRRFPKEWGFEKAMLNALGAHPQDFAGALQQLPLNLLILFVHGYQSYLFNRILSDRMREGLPIDEPVEGDLVLAARPDGRPDRDREIPVESGNLGKVAAQCRAGKAFVSGVLFGSKSEFAAGGPGEIERRVIESEGLRREDFVIPAIPRLSSKGTRRELLAPLRDLALEAGEGTLSMQFSLTPGCYGTSLLREFMKVPRAGTTPPGSETRPAAGQVPVESLQGPHRRHPTPA